MIKYNIAKIICIIAVIATIVLCSYIIYDNIIDYHADSLTSYSTNIETIPDPDIELAVLRSGEDGSPYNIRGLLAFYDSFSDGTLSIKVANTNDLDISLISVHDKKYKNQYPVSEIYLHPTGDDTEYITITIDNVDSSFAEDTDNMYIDYKYDDGNIWTAEIIPFTVSDYEVYHSTDIRTKDNIDEFDFISISYNTISFMGNDIDISKSMYIPKGYTVVIKAGQNINITNSAYIISYSPIVTNGTDSNEVRFYSSDGTGRGLYVCQASQVSILKYTSFNNLNTPKSGIWGLTGSVTFYESDVEISNCSFYENICEDALNIVRSDFVISNSMFSGTFGDAFDADFATGIISNSTFHNTGNDAIDVSTTTIDINNINFIDIGDKAISGGENSRLTIDTVNVKNAVIGIASKDMSDITGTNIDITDTTIGMTLYQKKPEFGPATINVSNVTLHSFISMDYLIQEDSIMILDGSRIYPRSETKENLLFEKMISGEPIN